MQRRPHLQNFVLLIILAFILLPFFSKSQTEWTSYDTLFKKYVVQQTGLNKYEVSYNGFGNKDVHQVYYCIDDTVSDSGDFFFCFGLCVSDKEDPFYFVKLDFCPIIDNSFYDYQKPFQIVFNLIGYNQSPAKLVIIGGIKQDGIGSLKFHGLSLKHNTTIFKLKNDEFLTLLKYDYGQMDISPLDGKFSAGLNLYHYISIIKRVASKIKVTIF